jgi:hypothetical protein
MHTIGSHENRQLESITGAPRVLVGEEAASVTQASDSDDCGTTIVPAAEPTDPLASRESMISHWRLPTFCEPEPGVTADDLRNLATAGRQMRSAAAGGTENRMVRDTLPSPPPSFEDLAS